MDTWKADEILTHSKVRSLVAESAACAGCAWHARHRGLNETDPFLGNKHMKGYRSISRESAYERLTLYFSGISFSLDRLWSQAHGIGCFLSPLLVYFTFYIFCLVCRGQAYVWILYYCHQRNNSICDQTIMIMQTSKRSMTAYTYNSMTALNMCFENCTQSYLLPVTCDCCVVVWFFFFRSRATQINRGTESYRSGQAIPKQRRALYLSWRKQNLILSLGLSYTRILLLSLSSHQSLPVQSVARTDKWQFSWWCWLDGGD